MLKLCRERERNNLRQVKLHNCFPPPPLGESSIKKGERQQRKSDSNMDPDQFDADPDPATIKFNKLTLSVSI